MKRFDRAFRSAATKLSSAATRTMQDMATRTLPDEPSVTAALVTRLRDALDGHAASGISWSARILSSHGPNTEERLIGADFLGVLTLNLIGYRVTKGFLAQAKRQEPGAQLAASEWTRLQAQCDAMLNLTPEAFIFIYSMNGVFVVPAISVLACSQPEDLHTLHPRSTGRFYTEHFQCAIGDRRIDTILPSPLYSLSYERGIHLSGVEKDQEG